ncbi:MAG: FKBP-type peptidyl-prolyl cis-trans isomerase [Bacteroidota bacterium]
MKYRIIFCLLATALFACTEPGTQDQAPEQSAEAPSTPATSSATNTTTDLPVPYVIADSSAFEDLGAGIKMYVIERGSGVIPKTGSNVVINYEGRLTDGTVFDGSFDKPGLMDFNLNQLIPGWQVALTAVETGSKIQVVIPPDMGYGARGQGSIPPNATLVFDIHLVSTY